MSCSATCWASVASGEFVVDLSAAVAQADRGNGALFRRFEGVGTTLDAHNAHVDALVGSGLVGRVLMWQKQKSACIVLFEAYLAASGAAGVAELIERAAASDTDRTDRADWSALFFDEGALSPAMGTSSHPQWRDIVCAAAGGEVVLARKAITPPQAVEVMQLVLANPAVQRLDLSYNVGCFGSDAAVAALCEVRIQVERRRASSLSTIVTNALALFPAAHPLTRWRDYPLACRGEHNTHRARRLRYRDLTDGGDEAQQSAAQEHDAALSELDQLQKRRTRLSRLARARTEVVAQGTEISTRRC